MSDDSSQRKVDVKSTSLEKGIDVAKGFIDKLVLAPAEELGLLIKDQISLWIIMVLNVGSGLALRSSHQLLRLLSND